MSHPTFNILRNWYTPKTTKFHNNRRIPTIDDDVAGVDAETILDEYDGEFIAGKAVNLATNCTGCDWWLMFWLVTTEQLREGWQEREIRINKNKQKVEII